MIETYTAVGFEAPWVLPVAALPAVLGNARRRRKTTGKWSVPPGEILTIAYFAIAVFAGMPVMWIMAFAAAAGGIYIAGFERRIVSVPIRWILGAVLVAFAWPLLAIGQKGPGKKIELGQDRVAFDYLGMSDSIRRSNLRIDVIHNGPEVMARPWGSWTLRGDGSLGLHIVGFWVYWGPNGLIRGDDLAAHIATWAGIKPKDETYIMSWTPADWRRAKEKWMQEHPKKPN
jgi:hypothetical protein